MASLNAVFGFVLNRLKKAAVYKGTSYAEKLAEAFFVLTELALKKFERSNHLYFFRRTSLANFVLCHIRSINKRLLDTDRGTPVYGLWKKTWKIFRRQLPHRVKKRRKRKQALSLLSTWFPAVYSKLAKRNSALEKQKRKREREARRKRRQERKEKKRKKEARKRRKVCSPPRVRRSPRNLKTTGFEAFGVQEEHLIEESRVYEKRKAARERKKQWENEKIELMNLRSKRLLRGHLISVVRLFNSLLEKMFLLCDDDSMKDRLSIRVDKNEAMEDAEGVVSADDLAEYYSSTCESMLKYILNNTGKRVGIAKGVKKELQITEIKQYQTCLSQVILFGRKDWKSFSVHKGIQNTTKCIQAMRDYVGEIDLRYQRSFMCERAILHLSNVHLSKIVKESKCKSLEELIRSEECSKVVTELNTIGRV